MKILLVYLFMLVSITSYGQIVMLKAMPMYVGQEHKLYFKVVEQGFQASSLEIKADNAEIAQPLQLSEGGDRAWLSVIPKSAAVNIQLHLWREGKLLKSYTVDVLAFSLDLWVNGQEIPQETTFSLQDSVKGLVISEKFMTNGEEDHSLKVYKWEVLLADNKRMLAIFKGDHQNLKEVSLTHLLRKATVGNRIVVIVQSFISIEKESRMGSAAAVPLERIWTIKLEE